MAVARKAKPASKRSGGGYTKTASKEVQALLNGQPTGVVTPTAGQSIGDVAMQIAREHQLKTYSILVDGCKVTTEGASKPLAGATSIEIFAKETRG